MANTLSTMSTEVQAIGPFSTSTASAGRITLWINQAMHWFLAGREWSFLEARATVASINGTADYVLLGTSPIVTDFGSMISVTHNTINAGPSLPKLRELDQQTFDDWFGAAAGNSGIPVFYTIRGGTAQTPSSSVLAGGFQNLSVYPAPGYVGSFRIAYIRSVASCELVNSSDICIVPIQWQSAIIARAAGFGLASKGQILQAQSLNTYAEEIRANAISEDARARLSDIPADIRPQLAPQQLAQGVANPALSPYGAKVA